MMMAKELATEKSVDASHRIRVVCHGNEWHRFK